MPEKPLISIITVNLNDVEGLKRTMTSVFDQSYYEFEHIVIDGGSTDGSKEYIEQHEAKFSYWVSEPDKGIYNAMNKGIAQANGKYLYFLNSGDFLANPEAIGKAVTYIENEDIIYFNVQVIEELKDYLKPTPRTLTYKFFKNDSLPHQGTFIKSLCFSKIEGYDENYQIISDWKFTAIGILKLNFSYKKVDHLLAVFIKDGISSKQRDLLFAERKEILNNEFQVFQKNESLERFKKNVLASKSIRLLRSAGFLKWMDGKG